MTKLCRSCHKKMDEYSQGNVHKECYWPMMHKVWDASKLDEGQSGEGHGGDRREGGFPDTKIPAPTIPGPVDYD